MAVELVVVGAIAGAVIGYVFLGMFTKGPRYPGDRRPYEGPGCTAFLAAVVLGAIIGAIAGAVVGSG